MCTKKDWEREGRKETNPMQAEEAGKAQRHELAARNELNASHLFC